MGGRGIEVYKWNKPGHKPAYYMYNLSGLGQSQLSTTIDSRVTLLLSMVQLSTNPSGKNLTANSFCNICPRFARWGIPLIGA